MYVYIYIYICLALTRHICSKSKDPNPTSKPLTNSKHDTLHRETAVLFFEEQERRLGLPPDLTHPKHPKTPKHQKNPKPLKPKP